MYSIAVGLLILVIILTPIMLFTKPCIVLATSKPEDEEKEGMIEFQNLNGEDDDSDGANNANDMNSNDMNEGGEGSSITEESELMEGGGMDVVAMRQKELR